MSRTNDLAARAAKVSTRPAKGSAPTGAGEAVPVARQTAAPRVKPVRLSIDLAPQNYRSLKAFCEDLAVELGLARVTHTEVVRAMLALLDQDPAVRQALTEAIRDER